MPYIVGSCSEFIYPLGCSSQPVQGAHGTLDMFGCSRFMLCNFGHCFFGRFLYFVLLHCFKKWWLKNMWHLPVCEHGAAGFTLSQTSNPGTVTSLVLAPVKVLMALEL